MFLPRVKSERLISDKRMTLSFPIKVWCGDRPSRNLLTVLHEMMPYGEFVQSAKKDADMTICVMPAFVQKPEFYTISCVENKIEMMATDYRGLVNAAATLAQAIHLENGKFVLPEIVMTDHPDSSWRSVMLDPARHVIPMDEVRAIILGMAKSKFNK